jgi:AcrR family transcriptional regulator
MVDSSSQGPASWLRAALQMLRSEGIEAVRIERMARALGVTKGSFYWHFRDHDALLAAMLAEWERRAGRAFLDRLDAASAAPVERLRLLFETVIREGRGALDPAIRAWALRDARAGEALARVDRLRLDWLDGLFREAGFGPADSLARSRLAYFALLGEHGLKSTGNLAERLGFAEKSLELLTR